MITKDFVDEFRRFADNEVHPVVSPDNWNVYSQLVDFIDELDESLDQISKDEEKEVAPVLKREKYHLAFFVCGACGTVITDGDRFCRMCGKKVKWE